MLLRCLGWWKREREDHILSYANALIRTDSESVETTVRIRSMLFTGFESRMGEERLPGTVMFGEMLGSKYYSGGQEWDGSNNLEEDLKAFGIKFGEWREAAQKVGRWARRVEDGAVVLMRKWYKDEQEATPDRNRTVATAILSGGASTRAREERLSLIHI